MSEMDLMQEKKNKKKEKVVSISEAGDAMGDKLDDLDIYAGVANHIKKKIIWIVIENNGGYYAKIKNDVVTPITYEYLKKEIRDVCKLMPRVFLSTLVKDSKMNEFLNYLNVYANAVSESSILPFAWKSQKGLSFCRLSFDRKDISECCPTPLWDDVVARCSNSSAFMDFIASIFVPESSRTQYLWLYGKGQTSKSSVTHVLTEALKATTISGSVSKTDAYFGADFAGKRLLVFNDTNNSRWVKSENCKKLTGGRDVFTARDVGEKRVYFKPICKIIFTSNEKPDIASERADTRRAIFCHLKPFSGTKIVDADYDDEMIREFPDFLSRCLYAFQERNPRFDEIMVDQEELKTLTIDNEMDLHGHVESHIDIGEDYFMTAREWSVVLGFCRFGHGRTNEAKNFMRFLSTNYGIEVTKKKIDGKVMHGYKGMKLKINLPIM